VVEGMVENAGTKKKAFVAPEHALHTSCLLPLVVYWLRRMCLGGRCRRCRCAVMHVVVAS
jgi:hypothetical protein